jgi:hypothetical protein
MWEPPRPVAEIPLPYLTMYNESECEAQNHWVSGLCPSSGILKSRKVNAWETDTVSETICFVDFIIPDDGRST